MPKDDNAKTVISINQAKMVRNTIVKSSDYNRVFIFCDRDDDNNIHEIICTEDHKIYANNKYIQAKDLQLSQNVIIYPQKHLK